MRCGGCEHDRIGIDRTTGRTTTTCWWIQRGTGDIEGGEGAPPGEGAAGLRRGHRHDRSGAHEVDPDVPPIGCRTGVIQDGNGGGRSTASVTHVHHEVAGNGLPDVEQVQPGLAPVQQPRRGGVVKITGRRNDRDGGLGRIDRSGRLCRAERSMTLKDCCPLASR